MDGACKQAAQKQTAVVAEQNPITPMRSIVYYQHYLHTTTAACTVLHATGGEELCGRWEVSTSDKVIYHSFTLSY